MGRRKEIGKRKRKVHLTRIEDVRRLLTTTINELRNGDVDGDRAGKIIYACNTLIKVFETLELKRRILDIQKELENEH